MRISKIIHSYFGKSFSETSRMLFGMWLINKNDEEEKVSVLNEIWNDIPNEITLETVKDWTRLSNNINAAKEKAHRLRRIKYSVAASVATLICATGGFMTFQSMQQTADPIVMAEVFVPFGESKTLLLPDSTEVWLNSGSTIVYPEDFSHFDTRSVYLTGNASFKVHKDKEHPFIVKAKNLNVTALGTVFAVESYPSQSFATTTLEEGSVRVDLRSKQESYTLNPGDQLCYDIKKGEASLRSIDIDQAKKVREGYIILNNQTIEMLVQSLERRYNVDINYDSRRYTGTYNVKFAPDESLQGALDVLKMLVGFRYTIKGNTIILY